MQLVAQPDVLYPRARIAAFPAPLCEACNVAMKLNGEYRASDASAARREYQCRDVRRRQDDPPHPLRGLTFLHAAAETEASASVIALNASATARARIASRPTFG